MQQVFNPIFFITLLYTPFIYLSDIEKENFINLNVGGYKYEGIPESLLLSRQSMLSKMFKYENKKDEEGNYLIYRANGKLFKKILNFLEYGRVTIKKKKKIYDLIDEAQYFCLDDLIIYLRLKLIDKEISFEIWKNFPLDKLKIIKIYKDLEKTYFIFNTYTNKIIGDEEYGYTGKNVTKKDLNLRKGNIVTAWTGFCSLPHNCTNNVCIGFVDKEDIKFNSAPLMNHIYDDKMCSRFGDDYAIFNIMTGEKILPKDHPFKSYDDCIEMLKVISKS